MKKSNKVPDMIMAGPNTNANYLHFFSFFFSGYGTKLFWYIFALALLAMLGGVNGEPSSFISRINYGTIFENKPAFTLVQNIGRTLSFYN